MYCPDFNWLKCLGGFLHLKPAAGCQISPLIFDFFMEGRSLLISHAKYINAGKVLDHLGFQSKVFRGPLTDLSACVNFCTSSPQQGVKYQHWYLIFFYGGGSLLISHSKYIKDGKVLDHLGFKSTAFPGNLTDLSTWLGLTALWNKVNLTFDPAYFLLVISCFEYFHNILVLLFLDFIIESPWMVK
jgi:hypothetical protein